MPPIFDLAPEQLLGVRGLAAKAGGPPGPVAVKWKKSGKAACEEEVMAHGVSKSCFESGLPECGGDQQCLDAIRAWIQQEEAAIELYKGMCKQFGR
jgi:hypothetical protein